MTETYTPESALDITEVDVRRALLADEARDSVAGVGNDLINIRSLQTEVDVLSAKAGEYEAQGLPVPRQVQVALDSKQKTLAWQTKVYHDNQAQYGGLERRDALAAQADGATTEMLRSARDTDMSSAVRREVTAQRRRGFRVSDVEAMQIVERRIESEGEAAVLPQYARIKARLSSASPSGGTSNADAAARKAPRKESTNVVDGYDLDKMERVIQQALAAGHDASDSIALLKYLKTKAA